MILRKTISVTVNAFITNLKKNFKVRKTNCGCGQFAVDIYEKKKGGAYIGTVAYVVPKDDFIDLRKDAINDLGMDTAMLVFDAYDEAA